MREIKFRGKRKDTGELKYGFYFTSLDIEENIEHNIRCVGKKGGYSDYLVASETVGQYTGLKDKNGVEIYEGDVVRSEDEEDYEAQVVEYGIQNVDAFIGVGFNLWPFMEKLDYSGEHNAPGSALNKYIVIGNIYENPELLKKLF